jgi:glycosyltransferase involved in cell wall biosynthesis
MNEKILRVKLSAIIVVRNEEKKIRSCLDSLRWVDEIVIVDQSSTDNTVKICREYTDKIFVVSAKGYSEPDRELASSKTSNDWVLYLDADEIVTEELKEEIISLLAKPGRLDSYCLPRKNYFLGQWIRGSGWYPGYVMRLFNKHQVRFTPQIHKDIIALTEPGYLKSDLLHYTCDNIEEYLGKINRYTSILAFQVYRHGERVTPVNLAYNLLLKPLAYAGYKYIFKKGFLDGFNGFLIAILTHLTVFLMYAKLWELQKEGDHRGGF